MKNSETLTKIAPALVKAQSEMSNAVKDAKNPFFKSSYADLNSVREACIPALNKNGITVLQPTVYEDGKPFVQTLLLHESGEYISSLTEIICNKVNDAQSQGSGVTYARRYGLQSMCNIGSEDDDGNAASAPVKKAEPTKKEKEVLVKGSERWGKVVNAFLKGITTIEQVKENLKVSPELEAELLSLTKTTNKTA